ncbi:MAG: polymer-forming cytoskeletal protein [Balneolaceae bacterium]
MFSKEAAKTKTNNSKSNSSGGPPTLNMISEGTRLTGDIHSDNDIRISGNVEGEARSKGKVILTSSGRVKGNIRAGDADIAGKLDGELFIEGKLVLRESAVIDGDIHTKTLLVEEGAQISGNCNMGVDNISASAKGPSELNSPNTSFKEGAA